MMNIQRTCCAGWLLSACLLGIAACGQPSANSPEGDASADLAALAERITAATAAEERLRSIRAVKRLQHAYGHYSELGLWHDFADLFSDDAVGHYAQGDLGREEIRRLFVEEVGQGMVGLADGRIYPHISLTPVVTLAANGQSAKARWRIVAMLGGYGRSASWALGVYENAYVNERGVWKVQEVTFNNQISGRYGESLRLTLDGPLDEPTMTFHYAPEQVGAPLLPIGSVPDANLAAGQHTFDELAARLSAVEARARLLADEDAVLNLQHAYGYYLDRKHWEDVADLFADDATMEIGQDGVYVGKASIRRGLERFGPTGLRTGEVNDHLLLQPIVSVSPDGATAKARGVYLGMTGRADVGAEWREGIYENEYVKDNGVWKIKTLHVYPRLVTDYDKGWAESAKPMNGPSDAFPPDRPPTLVYESYPTFFIAPLHFPHPVTGRSPQYPEGYSAGDASLASAELQIVAAPRTLDELRARLAAVERQVEAAAASEAAENLVNAFSYYADERMWDAAAALFASGGWAEVPGVGVYVGRERLRAALHAIYGARREGLFEFHQVAQPVIHPFADEQATRIRARLARIDARHAEDDLYIAGVYEAQVVKEDGAWRIEGLDLDLTWAANHSRGWARVADGEHADLFKPPSSSGHPVPDRPLTGPAAPPFPAIEDLPFHYANPVSGRAPARGSFQ
jgi:hypothetical protein